MSTDRGMGKGRGCGCVSGCVIECYSALKKNEILPFAATWMKLEIIILNEVSQKEKTQYDIIYMWNLKYDINEHIHEAETESWA